MIVFLWTLYSVITYIWFLLFYFNFIWYFLCSRILFKHKTVWILIELDEVLDVIVVVVILVFPRRFRQEIDLMVVSFSIVRFYIIYLFIFIILLLLMMLLLLLLFSFFFVVSSPNILYVHYRNEFRCLPNTFKYTLLNYYFPFCLLLSVSHSIQL